MQSRVAALPISGRCHTSVCSHQAGNTNRKWIGGRGTDTTNGHHGPIGTQEKNPALAPKRLRGNDLRFMGLGRVELPTSRLSGMKAPS